jgi:hypothetical protein
LAGLGLTALLAALAALSTLVLLTRLVLAALLRGVVLRIVLLLLVALRILLFVRHFRCSPVVFRKSPPVSTIIRDSFPRSLFHCTYFRQEIAKSHKNATFRVLETPPRRP